MTGKEKFSVVVFYTYRSVSCPVSIKEASSICRCEQIQRPTARHYLEGKSKLEVSIQSLPLKIRKPSRKEREERLQKSKVMQETKRTWSIKATKLTSYGLTETEAVNWVCMGLYQVLCVCDIAVILACYLGVVVGHQTVLAGTSLNLLPVLATLFLLEFPCPAFI